MAKTTRTDDHERTLAEIARRDLHIETLETRKSDGLDFHDVSVWGVKAALEAAYEAGWVAAEDAATDAATKAATDDGPTTAPCPRCGAEVTIHAIN